jgi:hypothetical protein
MAAKTSPGAYVTKGMSYDVLRMSLSQMHDFFTRVATLHRPD